MKRFDPNSLPWRGMDSAPRDGTIMLVCFHPWNDPAIPLKVQLAQWDTDMGQLIDPCDCASNPYAEGWLELDELFEAQPLPASPDNKERGNV